MNKDENILITNNYKCLKNSAEEIAFDIQDFEKKTFLSNVLPQDYKQAIKKHKKSKITWN